MKYFTLFFSILIHVVAIKAQNQLQIDSSFGQNGYLSLTPLNWEGKGLLEQPDGKLIIYGEAISVNGIGSRDVRLARLNPDGDFDLTFNGTGLVTTDVEYHDDFYIYDAKLQPDGKILIAGGGALSTEGSRKGILLRYMPDGALDASFANNGKWIFSVEDYSTDIQEVMPLADGTILFAASYDTSVVFGVDIGIGKLDINGNQIKSLGPNGLATLPSNLFYSVQVANFDPSGSLYLLGYHNDPSTWKSRLVKADVNGILQWDIQLTDTLYQDGQSFEPLFNYADLDAEGRLLVGGRYFFSRLIWVRLLPDGSFDPDFGESGVVSEAFGVDYTYAPQFFIQPDGKILTLGGHYFTALRLNPDGSSDLTFNDNGLIDAFPPNGFFGNNLDRSFGVYQQLSNQKILLAGLVSGKIQIARYNSTSCSE